MSKDFDKRKPVTAKPLSTVSATGGLPARTPPPGQNNNASTVRKVAATGGRNGKR